MRLDLDAIPTVVSELLGEAPSSVARVSGGGNNLVARAELAAGPVLVKAYFHSEDDPRDRLGVEFGLLTHLWSHGVRVVPEPLAADPARRVGIYRFVKGVRAEPDSITLEDARALTAYLGAHWDLRNAEGAADLPLASEATFTARDHLNLLDHRLASLRDGIEPDALGRVALGFVNDELAPAMSEARAAVAAALDLDAVLPQAERTLSPSDHGFHNALRTDDGWVFLDLEYGGWDDPAKMLSDACLHPGVPLPRALWGLFLSETLARLGPPQGLPARLRALFPLWSIKWCLIFLNEFMPMYRARREFAGRDAADRRPKQLEKARARLAAWREEQADPSFLPEG